MTHYEITPAVKPAIDVDRQFPGPVLVTACNGVSLLLVNVTPVKPAGPEFVAYQINRPGRPFRLFNDFDSALAYFREAADEASFMHGAVSGYV